MSSEHSSAGQEPIMCLDLLFNELTRILHHREDPAKLDKCQRALESYKGSDWILHSTVPEVKGFQIQGYSRAQVRSQPDLFSLLILTWSPKAKSAIHSHPCERCFLMPLQGDMSEVLYKVDEASNQTDLLRTIRIPLGTAAWIDDSHGWHSVQNNGNGLAVSLHVYIPAFRRCKIVDPTTGTIRWVNTFPSPNKGVPSLHERIFDAARKYISSLEQDGPTGRPVVKLRTKHDIEQIFEAKCPLGFTKDAPPTDDGSLLEAVGNTCDFSTNTGHLYFFNQLFARADPLAVSADCLATCLNANMYTFEMAPVFLLMERRLLQHMASFLGWHTHTHTHATDCSGSQEKKTDTHTTQQPQSGATLSAAGNGNIGSANGNGNGNGSVKREESLKPVQMNGQVSPTMSEASCAGEMQTFDGILNPGGALSNLMAVNLTRHLVCPDAKRKGLYGMPPLVAFTSEQGHNSLDKACALLGLGSDNLIRIPVDPKTNSMDTVKLREAVIKAKFEGKKPFFVNCTAGTTVAGAFDDFVAVRAVCDEFALWMHVDGAVGASFLLPSEEPYASLCRGMRDADSISWNIHKLLGVPLQCSALLTRHVGLLKAAHSPSDYATYASLLGVSSGSNHGNTHTHTNGCGNSGLHLDPLERQCSKSGFNMCSPFERLDTCDHTFQAGRRADAFKAWCLWKKLGDLGMANRIRLIYTHAQQLAEMVKTFPRKLACLGEGGHPVLSTDNILSSPRPPTTTPQTDVCPHTAQQFTTPVHAESTRNVEFEEAVPEGMPGDVHGCAFALVWEPSSVNCCFWWIPYDLRKAFKEGGYSAIASQLELVAPVMKKHMLIEGSLMVDYHRIGGRPSFWRVPLVNPDICRDDIFNVLRIINRIGTHCFPPGTFEAKRESNGTYSITHTGGGVAGVCQQMKVLLNGVAAGGVGLGAPELWRQVSAIEKAKELPFIGGFDMDA